MFNQPGFRGETSARGGEFHQLGAHRGADPLLFHARSSSAHRNDRIPSLCPPAISATSRRLRGDAHGPADRASCRRDERQRHPGASLGGWPLCEARRGADGFALDGYRGVVEFRTASLRGSWPGCGCGAGRDEFSCAIGRFPIADPRSGRFAPNSTPIAPRHKKPRDDARDMAGSGLSSRSAHGGRRRDGQARAEARSGRPP